MLSRIESSTPYKESTVLAQHGGVTSSNDLLNRNIFQVVNFKWNIGAEFVSLTKITGCIVAHCIDLIRVV